jgi:hypothetical protein
MLPSRSSTHGFSIYSQIFARFLVGCSWLLTPEF